MTVVIQTWNKSEVFWSVQISSLNHLLNLIESKHAIQEEYTTLIESEEISRTTTNVYEDEIKEKISNDFEEENNDDFEDESINISEDFEKNFSILSSITNMTDSEEWTNTKKEEMNISKTLNQSSFESHVIDLEDNALLITFANDIMKNSLNQDILNVFDQ